MKWTIGKDCDDEAFDLDLTQLYLFSKVELRPPQSVFNEMVAKLLFQLLNAPNPLVELFWKLLIYDKQYMIICNSLLLGISVSNALANCCGVNSVKVAATPSPNPASAKVLSTLLLHAFGVSRVLSAF